jgi:hypothetical protein
MAEVGRYGETGLTGEVYPVTEQARVLEALRQLPGRHRQVMAWAYDG